MLLNRIPINTLNIKIYFNRESKLFVDKSVIVKAHRFIIRIYILKPTYIAADTTNVVEYKNKSYKRRFIAF